MPQYPNDPGTDNQKPIEYSPLHRYEILTTDVFASAMEIQTKYSYLCSKQLMENAICHTNKTFEELERRIINLNDNFQEALDKIDDMFKTYHDAINTIKGDCVELYRRTDNIREDLNNRLTDHERCVILAQIYDLA